MLTQKSFFIGTTSSIDLIPIGHDVRGFLREAQITNGIVTVSCRQAGACLVVLSTEGRAAKEDQERVKKGFGESVPGPMRPLFPLSLSIPVEQGKMFFEPWQDLFLIDYESKGRRREVVVQLFSEPPPTEKKRN